MRLYHLYLSKVSLLAMVDVGQVPLLGETSQGSSKEAGLYRWVPPLHITEQILEKKTPKQPNKLCQFKCMSPQIKFYL